MTYSDGIPYHVQLICYHAFDADTDLVLDAGDFRKALVQKNGVLDALNNKFYEDAFKRVGRVWKKAGECLKVMAEARGQISGLVACQKRVWNYRVQFPELDAGICGRELPVYAHLPLIAFAFPGSYLPP